MTPVRKLLRKLPSFRRRSDGVKRIRIKPSRSPSESDESERPLFQNRVISTSPPRTPSNSRALDEVRPAFTDPGDPNTTKRARLAIQQHDENHDAVIVTTLPEFPFCCHEDLLTMSHSRLLRVADLFNSRLPSPTRIPDTEDVADEDIRHSIENLVGITPIPPGGLPKAAKSTNTQTVSNGIEDSETGRIRSPPSSPLAAHASRKLKRGISWTQPLSQFLDVLPEEDETEDSSLRRTNKKQKLDANQAVSTK